VRLFNVAADEHVVSAARIDEEPEPEDAAEAAVAAELDEAPPVAASDQLTLDDGTGPDTLGEQVDESDDDGDQA
jgi:DNA gyrase subunit A